MDITELPSIWEREKIILWVPSEYIKNIINIVWIICKKLSAKVCRIRDLSGRRMHHACAYKILTISEVRDESITQSNIPFCMSFRQLAIYI